MNEVTVAKNLANHLREIYAEYGADEITVMGKAKTAEHGYTSGDGATILWEGGPMSRYGSPWTYDTSNEMLDWVQERYGNKFWLEAVNHWMLKVLKD